MDTPSFAKEANAEDNFLAIRRSLTYICLTVYGAFFTYIYIQLWLVIKYGYKRWCYRTYVLYISIVWCVLRITLFSYYAMLEHRAAYDIKSSEPNALSRRVGFLSYFLLFSFPLYLQFTCLCIMVAYFYQIYRSSRSNFHPSELNVWRWPTYVLVLLNVVVLAINMASSVVIKWQEDNTHLMGSQLLSDALHDGISPTLPLLTVYVVHLRVVVNGITFMMVAAALAYVTVHVAKTNEARLLLETENLTQRSSVLVCILLVFLYACRTVINVLALIPAVSFVLDTDQVDLLCDNHGAYYMFVTVLFLWEMLPTLLVVAFFRVKAPLTHPPRHPTQSDYHQAQYLTDSLSDGSSEDGGVEGHNRYSFLCAGQHRSSLARMFSRRQRTTPARPSGAGNANLAPPLPPIAYSPNSQYSYEVADPTGGGGNNNSVAEVMGQGGDSSGQYTTSSASPTSPIAPVYGDNVHSLSTRFTHRTSLSSYLILNRANRP